MCDGKRRKCFVSIATVSRFLSLTCPHVKTYHRISIFLLAPANEAIEYHTTVFNGSFDFPSIYRGVPTQDIDDAWNQVSREGEYLRIAMVLGCSCGA